MAELVHSEVAFFGFLFELVSSLLHSFFPPGDFLLHVLLIARGLPVYDIVVIFFSSVFAQHLLYQI